VVRALFEEEAQLRQRAGLNRGSEFPVVENSLQRRKHEEKRGSDEKAAQLRKVSDLSDRVADNITKQRVTERGYAHRFEGFPKRGFAISAWVQAGRECQCRGLFVGDPHPAASGGEVIPERPSAW
jgi:hypothetical protein